MSKKIWIGTMIIFALVCVAGCGKKTPLTEEEFVLKMLDMGYGVLAVNATDEGVSQWEAGKDNNRVGFAIYGETQEAVEKYNRTISIYEKNPAIEIKENKETENGSRCLVYADYGNSDEAIYLLFSRIDNTILTISIPESNEKEFKELVKVMGY